MLLYCEVSLHKLSVSGPVSSSDPSLAVAALSKTAVKHQDVRIDCENISRAHTSDVWTENHHGRIYWVQHTSSLIAELKHHNLQRDLQ